MPTRPDPATTPHSRRIEDVTCLGCGCLCDDLTVTVQDNVVAEVGNACPIGRRWLESHRPETDGPDAIVDGRAVSREDAVIRAGEVLSSARSLLITGLESTTIEAQRLALALADRLGATIATTCSQETGAILNAIQRLGRVGASLGEVRHRADLVLFWNVDPVTTHPRHLERYSVDPVGRFVPEGRLGRTVLVADTHWSDTAARADDFLQVPMDRRFEVLWSLRAMIRNIPLDPESVNASTGVPYNQLRAWADRMTLTRYGAVFYGTETSTATAEALLQLIRDLNERTRFVALPIGAPGNLAGAEAVLAWQTGYPDSVDFSRRIPRYRPGEVSVEVLIETDRCDAILILGPAELESHPERLRRRPASIPSVWIARGATTSGIAATVAMASAIPGLHSGGTVARADGAWLPLRPALVSTRPTDSDWLGALLRQLDTIGVV